MCNFISDCVESIFLIFHFQMQRIIFCRNVVSTWSSGTGGAGIIGSLSYLALADVLGVRWTILLMLVIPAIQAVTFWILMVHPAPKMYVLNKSYIGSQQQIIEVPKKTIMEKIHMVPSLMKYMLPLALVYFFEYFINQGLVCTYFFTVFQLIFNHDY